MIDTLARPVVATAQRVSAASRLFFIDNLRVFLIALVVIHHLALTYSGIPIWYYVEATPSTATSTGLFALIMLNQGFFMGLFFMISAYFAPGSVDRKGSVAFLKDRLIRLGVPLVVYYLVVGPLTAMVSMWKIFNTPPSWETYVAGMGFGPLWFLELLLAFSLVYAGVRRWRGTTPVTVQTPLTAGNVVLFAGGLAITTYLWRIVVPVGYWTPIIDFPTLSYLPQYTAMFVAGVLAYRNDWLRTIPRRLGIGGFVAALLVTVVLFPLGLLTLPLSSGGGTWQSAVYALWDSTFVVGMALGLTELFRRRFNGGGVLATFLSRHTYGVYLVHAPVIVLLAIAMAALPLHAMVKFVVAVVLGIPLCYLVAFVLRKLPAADRVV